MPTWPFSTRANRSPRGIGIGIGIIAPLRVERGFVVGGKGFYWLHTHDASGILHVESPNDRAYTLGNFFDVWGQPLAADNVAGLKGSLKVYVNGKVQFAPLRDLSLKPHDQTALVIGQPSVVPVKYTFTDGL